MNPWPFVILAYVITLGATVVTTVTVMRSAREAEARADERLRRD